MVSTLPEVISHLQSTYPDEGCGVVLRAADGTFVARPMKNAYDRYHAADPETYPRTNRTAYLFDPREWLALSEEADRQGAQVACVFHSHCDVGAYFSAEDKAMATPDGIPALPGVTYWVLAIDAGKATAGKAFLWGSGAWSESELPIG